MPDAPRRQSSCSTESHARTAARELDSASPTRSLAARLRVIGRLHTACCCGYS
jgi:hypothetical protein